MRFAATDIVRMISFSIAVLMPLPAAAFNFNAQCAEPGPGSSNQRIATPSTLAALINSAQPGDAIALTTGNYGHVVLNRSFAGFVTVQSAPGQRPVLASLQIRGGPWAVRGLIVEGVSSAIQGGAAPLWGNWPSHDSLVKIDNANNVMFEGNLVASSEAPFPWKQEFPGVPDPQGPSSGIHAGNSSCVSIAYNNIYNVFNGIEVSGDQVGSNGKYFVIIGNKIDNFAGDGIDHSVSYALIKNNSITNNHGICGDVCVHSDGIQGWNYNNLSGIINYDITIDSNTIISQNVPSLPMPSDNLQGITIFDGFWSGVNILNNVVVSNTYHGISLYGVTGLAVINNTVAADRSGISSWIGVGGTSHQGGISSNIIVRNNIAPYMYVANTLPRVVGLEVDHNSFGADPKSLFYAYDPVNYAFDLHLLPGSSAIGQGSPNLAPPFDHDGVPRSGAINIGAYQTPK